MFGFNHRLRNSITCMFYVSSSSQFQSAAYSNMWFCIRNKYFHPNLNIVFIHWSSFSSILWIQMNLSIYWHGYDLNPINHCAHSQSRIRIHLERSRTIYSPNLMNPICWSRFKDSSKNQWEHICWNHCDNFDLPQSCYSIHCCLDCQQILFLSFHWSFMLVIMFSIVLYVFCSPCFYILNLWNMLVLACTSIYSSIFLVEFAMNKLKDTDLTCLFVLLKT